MNDPIDHMAEQTPTFVTFLETALQSSLVDRFEEQVLRRPDAPAIQSPREELSYCELNGAANCAAHALLDICGHGPENVALVLENGAPAIIGILAVLKTGKTYVPLDPTYPRNRNEFVISDTEAKVILTNRANQALAIELAGTNRKVLVMDRMKGSLPSSNPGLRIHPDTIAYILYSSGTTGQPKGGPHSHANVLCEVMNYTNACRLCAGDRMLLVSSYSFADAVRTIFGALLNGASLRHYDIRRDGLAGLAEFVDRQRITVFRSVPTVYRNFLSALPPERRFQTIRLAYLAGEPVYRRDIELIRAHFPCESIIVNGLGTSETLTFCANRIASGDEIQNAHVPVGHPWPHRRVILLDDEHKPVSSGEMGEFAVGTRYMVRDFWRRPDLAAEKFVPDPQGGDIPLYLTGDLGRQLPDGSYVHLGRKDFQIKIRGHRIEAAELEQVLMRTGLVRQAVVAGRPDWTGEMRLIAYIVPHEGPRPTVTELRRGIAGFIPDYMMPSLFVILAAMPLLPNGKLNVRALPEPDQVRPELETAYVQPRTPVEQALVRIWAEALGLEKVGIHDNFFELGGHSLLASKVVSQACHIFHVDLPLRRVFETPTVAGMAEHVQSAVGAKQQVNAPAMIQMAREEKVPLSFAQQRLWFLDRWEPDSPFYNVPKILHVTGPLDLRALKQSLSKILERHEALRTTFADEQGQPVQRIAKGVELEVAVTDLMDLPETKRSAEAHRRAAEEAQRPFDLTHGPLFRANLYRSGEQDHVLVLAMHHIVTDGWSLGVFFRELSLLYEAFSSGKPSPLPDLPIQYADFAVWQRQWLQDEVLERELEYWKEQLRELAVLELPTDRPRPQALTYRGARQGFALSSPLVQSLKALSRQESVTLFMTLLAAFQTLLHRYSGQEDIAVGSPIANRNREEIEELIGFFVNTLVLRTRLEGNPSFRELLGRVREVALGAYTHQDLPFEKLVEELRPDRDPARSPLFQVMLVLQNAPNTTPELQGLTVESLEGETETAKFDLTLTLTEDAGGLKGSIGYNTDLFDKSTIKRMIGHFQTLLEGIVANPDQRLSELPLLTPAERYQLVVEWNDTRTDYPRDACTHHLFESQVERTPDAVALVFEDQKLTYRELNARANQLAHYLRKHGVGPDVLVGICLERSIEMVVGLLGILKAGGAYVPLDPTYPKERLEFMLQDARVTVLVTQQSLSPSLPRTHPQTVVLDQDGEAINRESQDNPGGGPTAENLAYVIYTSGSTGRPKGVLISHRSVCSFAFGLHNRIYAPNGFGTLRVSLNAPLVFDASVQQLVMLLYGHALYVIPDSIKKDANRFCAYLRANKIDVLDCVPTQLAVLLDSGLLDGSDYAPLLILSGGELISTKLWRRLSQFKGTHSYNVYGPTECAVDSTSCCVKSSPDQSSIGRPLPNVTVHILDRNLEPLPIGVPGELHIGGDGLAQGYLNRPELTKEKFIPDPFSAKPNARLYRTGDLARFRPDGNIEFLGRIDHQVKIRGFRIELGEIEAVLGQHPGIREAVVLAREDVPGYKRLVAYAVTSSDTAATSSGLKRFLQQKLPDYMIPSTFVFLNAMPLAPGGKIDRRALPAPDQTRPKLEVGYVAPRTPVEEVMVGIWAEVLRVQRVGIYDSFFELGGHSLLATRVTSKVKNIFGVDLPLRRLFETPSVAGLAEHVQSALSVGQQAAVPPLRQVVRQDELPLSFAQQRLWFLDRWEPGSSYYNVPTTLRITGPLNLRALRQSLNEILQRHEALRTAFAEEQGQPVQRIATGVELEVAVTDLLSLPEAQRRAEAHRRAAEEAQRPFDLTRGPLFRASVLRLGEQEHVLVIAMHHIVTDGWSMGVFFRELNLLYESFSSANPSPLLDLPIQYADFAVWQRQWLQGEALERELEYWKKQLRKLAVLELPTDRPRPPMLTYRGARQDFVLSAPLAETLKALSRRESVTLFMTLLTAFQTLLFRYCGQDDVVVGSPIANRNHVEIEGLIGFFVNTLVLRTRLEGNPSFRELLARVREVALGAYAHRDLPFERLVEELNPERDPSRSPLFQVMLVLQNAPDTAPKLPGLTVEFLRGETETAKFDLTLFLTEDAGEIRGSFEYNTDLFDGTTIGRMIGHFQTLLEGIVANSDQRLSELPLLTPAERHQLLVESNNTRTDYPRDACIHHLFEAQVEHTPDAVAVAFEDRKLTYRELDIRANQLAHYFRKHGVGPDVLVGICVERSIEMIVGLLAILKAGGAYVPLDPKYPEERLSFMLQDAGITVLVTQPWLQELHPTGSVVRICLTSNWDPFSRQPETSPIGRTSPENLAYIIYTSGSTGTPKGVAMTHRALCNLISWQLRRAGIEKPRCLQFAPLGFDVSIQEIFATWCSGGTLVLISDTIRRDPTALVDFLIAQCIERLFLPFVALQQIAQSAGRSGSVPHQMREVFVAGEQLQITPSIAAWFEKLPQCVLENQYGPSESHVVTAFTLEGSPRHWPTLPPIGRPIANTQIYILDRNLQPVPPGVSGELYIGGDGLARGYLNRPDLTAEKFISDPFSTLPGARLYRTGDLARYRPDGNIEFLGRIDHQVKIRGFRIELGEVEVVLGKHTGIREAVVVAREDVPGEKRLVAYVVANSDTSATPSELRRFLQQKLPDYMIPSVLVFLDTMPLTPGGKVDRRALPAPDQARPNLEGNYVAPRTPMEEALAGIWTNVLGVERVGIDDNFFALGGHSLLAVQLVSRIEKRFGIRMPVAALFQYPAIADLAKLLEAKTLPQSWSSLMPIQPEGSRLPFFWVHGDSSNALLPKYLGPDQPLYALEHQAHDGRRARYTQTETIAKHYLDEVCTVQPHGPYLLGGYSFGALTAFEMAQQLRRKGEEVALLFMLDPSSEIKKELSPLPPLPPLTLRGIIKKHWRELSRLRLREKLNYLYPRVRDQLRSRMSRATRHFRKLRWKCCLAVGWPLPVSLRSAYILNIYRQAIRLYRPQPYSGRVILYRSIKALYCPPLDWLNLFTGELEVHEGDGGHEELREEPYVAQWAQQLKASFDRVQHAAPSWYEPCTAFPLTSNNKVDRKALAQSELNSRLQAERSASIAPDDVDAVLKKWNDTKTPLPEASVDILFERHAARQPDKTAILWQDEIISYSALNAQANVLAHRLKSLGAGHSTRIALVLKHSPVYIRAVLGVLKAGGVYVPIPANYPAERIAFMIEDSGAKIVLSEQAWLEKLRETSNPILLLDNGTDWSRMPVENPVRETALGDPALILYTSGSTGKPKGVLLPHSSILRLAVNTNFLKATADDVVTHFSSIGFAIAIFEVWIALASGAVLAILPQETALNPLECKKAYEKFGVSIAFLTTSLFNLAAQECPEMFGNLKCVCFGGEKADSDAVLRVLERAKPERLLNVYGCTETSSIVSFYDVPASQTRTPNIPIGRPTSNAVLYVVDENLRLVRIGETGEIVVGGLSVADGYVNRQELSAEKFVPNPFGEPSGRLYRTGDRGYFLPDGNLVCVGRQDDQVSLHGYRVELGEIEAVLLSLPSVKHGAVVLHGGAGSKEAIAFWVAHPGHEDADLKSELSRKLPDYMIPGAFVRLPSLPLNSGGKIDRPALVAHPIRQGKREIRVPSTEFERHMAALFQEVLNIPVIGLDEGFFELGGDSILAIRLITRIERDFGINLSIESVLDNDTPAELLQVVQRERALSGNPDPATRPQTQPASE